VSPDLKSERFMIRMDPDEREMLRELADAAGESEATIVRRLIRAAHADRKPGRDTKKKR